MQIRNTPYKQPSIRTYPLQKSNSMGVILSPCTSTPTNDHIDSLSNFRKDFAAMDNQRRQKQMQKKCISLEKRKQSNLLREIHIKQNQQQANLKWQQRQHKAQFLYQKGQLKNTLVTSLPINPINSSYNKNQYGSRLAAKDQEKGLDRIVRAHYLHTLGNSGYNIINGGASIDFQKMVAGEKFQAFQDKIGKLYARFKLNPEGH